MIFIDANVFLAFNSDTDVHHQKAKIIFEQIDIGKYHDYFTSDYVFNEVVGVTLRKFGKERAKVLGEHIRASALMMHIDKRLLRLAWKLFKETPLNLSLVDCTNVELMKATKTDTIATFDKEFFKISELNIINS